MSDGAATARLLPDRHRQQSRSISDCHQVCENGWSRAQRGTIRGHGAVHGLITTRLRRRRMVWTSTRRSSAHNCVPNLQVRLQRRWRSQNYDIHHILARPEKIAKRWRPTEGPSVPVSACRRAESMSLEPPPKVNALWGYPPTCARVAMHR